MSTIGFPPPESAGRTAVPVPRQVRRTAAARDERHEDPGEETARKPSPQRYTGNPEKKLSDEEILKILRALNGHRGTLVDKSV